MWIYLKNNWVLFILKMSGSRGSPYTPFFFLNLSIQLISILLQNHTSKKIFRRLFLISFPKCPSSSTTQNYAPNAALYWFIPYI